MHVSPKILIIKSSSLGDIIHVFPVLNYLRERFPNAQIDWVIEKPFYDLVKGHPGITNVIPIATKTWRKGIFRKETWKEICSFRKQVRSNKYDLVFDLQGNIKSGLVLSQVIADKKMGFGKKTVPEWPNIFFTRYRMDPPSGKNIREDYLNLVKHFLKDPSPYQDSGIILNLSPSDQEALERILSDLPTAQTKVLICPGSAWPNKQVSQETLLEVMKNYQTHKDPYFLYSWGNEKERLLSQSLQSSFPDRGKLLDKLSLPLLQNLMSQMDVVVAMDSLPLHLCGTTKTASLSFFGPSSAKKYCPLGPQHRYYQGSCPYGENFEKRCSKLRTCATGACLKTLPNLLCFQEKE